MGAVIRHRTVEFPRRHGTPREGISSSLGWWDAWSARRDRRRWQRSRLRDAHRFGQELARHWLAGRGSVVRSITPGVGDSFVAAAFRHGLVAGTSFCDAVDLAQAVLSGMADTARNSSSRPRRGRRAVVDPSHRDAARRGVNAMAAQVLREVESDFALGRATIEKIRSWSLDRPSHARHGAAPTLAGRR